MYEKKFLAYVLYITLLEIREQAYATQNARLFHLADMLHNVPFSLFDDNLAKEEYERMLQTVEHLKIQEWLESRRREFLERFPES